MGKSSNKKVDQKIKQMEKEVIERGLVDDTAALEKHKKSLAAVVGDDISQTSASESTARDKPFEIHDLLDAVKQMLGKSEPKSRT